MGESLKQTFERLPSKCTISEIVSANPSFDKCTIKVLYDGLNRNRTYISKESVEEAIPSIFNIPIVCHYIKSGDDAYIGGHDEEFDQDGKSVNLTQPVGVIPESANYWWEDIVDGGKKHTYFCVEGILWKRQDAYNFIKSQGSLGQSMEINILICHSEASYQKIDKFAFEALCILGDDYEPCFESASIDTYSYDKSAFALMLREYKEAFALDNKINTNTTKDKEGVDKLNYKLFGEELAESLYKVLRDEESVSNDWGEVPRYWFVDYDPDTNETFCYDDKEDELVSFTFTVNGDVVTVDFNTRKKKKYTIVDFDDGNASPIDNFIKIGEYMAETKNQKSFQDAKDNYETQISERNGVINSLSAEVADLREYKKNIEHETFIQTLDGVFSNFADLQGIDEYDRLLNSFEEYKNGRLDAEFEYTEDSLTEKCYAIKGKNIQTKATYSKQKQQAPTPKLTITHQDPKESKDELPYNGYFEQF